MTGDMYKGCTRTTLICVCDVEMVGWGLTLRVHQVWDGLGGAQSPPIGPTCCKYQQLSYARLFKDER